MSNLKSIDPKAVLSIMQERYPLQYDICVQQAYINNLESALAEKDSKDVNELPDQS
ncbi:MAG: hypothetical protein ACO3VQ_02540 [Ilumatobacteraceae bacterium]